jgi:integrase
MARGYTYRPTYVYKREKRRSDVWHIGWSVNGRKMRESSGSTVKADAEVLLAKRIAETRPGGMLPRERGRVMFEDLADRLREDYKRKGNRSRPRLHHLSEHFAGWRAVDIDEQAQAIDAYVGKRTRAKAAGATINRALAALRRMLRLAYRARLLDRVPAFEMLGEEVREGFVDEDGLQKLLAELPEHLRPLVEALYVSSWRVQDMLSRDWSDVDFERGLRIEGSDTKEKAGRVFPMIPRLRAILEAQRERADAIEAETGRKVEAVFFYYERTHNGNRQAGDRIRDFRGAWASACERAGMPDLRVHDLRRSGIRSFVRGGIGENLAMKFSGHKTAHVFRR